MLHPRSMLQLLFRAAVRSALAVPDHELQSPEAGDFLTWIEGLGESEIEKTEKTDILSMAMTLKKFEDSEIQWQRDLAEECLHTKNPKAVFGYSDGKKKDSNNPATRGSVYWHALGRWEDQLDEGDRLLVKVVLEDDKATIK